MKPKEKAEELINKFREYANGDEHGRFSPGIEKQNGKLCALIAVDEILKNSVGYNAYDGVTDNDIWADDNYWVKVKQEIEKL